MKNIPEIIIDFDDRNNPLEDVNIEREILIIEDGGVFYTSNELAIIVARYLHKKKLIKIKYITFNGKIINVDKNGELDKYPEGFCKMSTKLLLELV